MSDVTIRDVVEVYEGLAWTTNAPELVRANYKQFLEAFQGANVRGFELREAARSVIATETFWPAPAKLLEHVRRIRIEAGEAVAKAEQDARLRQAEVRRLAPAQPIVDERSKVPPGYPPKHGPPRNPKLAGKMPTGRIDSPFWPELPSRSLCAWKRKAMYDHGILSWGAASALTEEQARKHKGGALADAVAEAFE